jgi:signal transduction histidine kinase
MQPAKPTMPRRPPTFVWQGLLIVLPVAALTLVGFLSLRQDRRLAEQEARERAQTLADQLAEDIWQQLSLLAPVSPDAGPFPVPLPPCPRFQLGEQGELAYPPACPEAQAPPPLDATALTAAQAQLWLAARAAEFTTEDPAGATAAYQQFLDTKPPEAFAALATYAAGVLLARQDRLAEARELFGQVLAQYASARAESGLPLAPVAQWQTLNTVWHSTNAPESRAVQLNAFCSNQVFQPSPWSGWLLAQAAQLAQTTNQQAAPGTAPDGPHADCATLATRWLALWENHEVSRRLYRAVYPAGTYRWEDRPARVGSLANYWLPLRWVDLEEPWLVCACPQRWHIGRNGLQVQRLVGGLLARPNRLPPYLKAGVTVAGRAVIAAPARPWSRLLASNGATGEEALAGLPPTVRVDIGLAAPELLFARQRVRSWWFGGLIAAAATAALAGLVAAQRAFRRQLRLSQMKSDFVASASHELRAPIASVRLLAESLDRGKVQDESRRAEYFGLIVQECRRLSALIENVLDFSRIDQGRKQYEFEATDLAALVAQTVKVMAPYAAERQVALELSTQGEPAPIEADGKALQQALVNLIDNAVKHSPAGQTVTVGLEFTHDQPAELPPAATSIPTPIPNPNLHPNPNPPPPPIAPETDQGPAAGGGREMVPVAVRLWVEDRGQGIPLSDQRRVFEPFYRRGSELRRETQGIGIGLSIVRHVAEAHGGRVSVESAAGKGSRFTIQLPARRPALTNTE